MAKDSIKDRLEALKKEALEHYNEVKTEYEALTKQYAGYGWIDGAKAAKSKGSTTTGAATLDVEKSKAIIKKHGGKVAITDFIAEYDDPDITTKNAGQKLRHLAEFKREGKWVLLA